MNVKLVQRYIIRQISTNERNNKEYGTFIIPEDDYDGFEFSVYDKYDTLEKAAEYLKYLEEVRHFHYMVILPIWEHEIEDEE